jgi:hypothetical protein
MIEDVDVEKALDYLRDNAEEVGAKKAQMVYLKEFRKSKKAMLRQQSNAPTEGGKDDYAYSHAEYLEVLDGIRESVSQDESARWMMKAAEAKIEAYRTQQANYRAMKI